MIRLSYDIVFLYFWSYPARRSQLVSFKSCVEPVASTLWTYTHTSVAYVATQATRFLWNRCFLLALIFDSLASSLFLRLLNISYGTGKDCCCRTCCGRCCWCRLANATERSSNLRRFAGESTGWKVKWLTDWLMQLEESESDRESETQSTLLALTSHCIQARKPPRELLSCFPEIGQFHYISHRALIDLARRLWGRLNLRIFWYRVVRSQRTCESSSNFVLKNFRKSKVSGKDTFPMELNDRNLGTKNAISKSQKKQWFLPKNAHGTDTFLQAVATEFAPPWAVSLWISDSVACRERTAQTTRRWNGKTLTSRLVVQQRLWHPELSERRSCSRHII